MKRLSDDILELMAALAEPFEPANVHCKPLTISGNRALAAWYADARDVQDRLDEVFGLNGWQDSYTVLDGGLVKCTLRVRVGDEWITKEDVGGQSEQPDEGDRAKSAFSDALKRSAVKLGVGRYLYRLGRTWYDWDAQKKRWTADPVLPPHALPRRLKASEADEIRKLLTETDSNEGAFLDALTLSVLSKGGVADRPESVEAIPARLFAKARQLLNGKKARLAQHEAEVKSKLKPAPTPAAG